MAQAGDPFHRPRRDGRLVEVLLASGRAQKERAATDVADLAGHTLGVVVDTGNENITGEFALECGHAQVVLDVAGRLFQVEGFQAETTVDAVAERLGGSDHPMWPRSALSRSDNVVYRSECTWQRTGCAGTVVGWSPNAKG